ncbi:uncharacterized protein VNE69_07143 [Vairimorpha necatrix]|uniref:Uncharacterized protein n=1 Tax=Vairimorpha necatrix TaxID=6039 RepID=A0AAX4JDM1_9MICR
MRFFEIYYRFKYFLEFKKIKDELYNLSGSFIIVENKIHLLKIKIEPKIKEMPLESHNEIIFTAAKELYKKICELDNRTFPKKEIENFYKRKCKKQSILQMIAELVKFKEKIYKVSNAQKRFIEIVKQTSLESVTAYLKNNIKFSSFLIESNFEPTQILINRTNRIIHSLEKIKIK